THQALLLPAAEIDAAASNLGVVTVRQAGDILLQGAGAHDRVVPRRIVFISCYDVVADGQVAQPWRLIAVGRRCAAPTHKHTSAGDWDMAENGMEQKRFPAPHGTENHGDCGLFDIDGDVLKNRFTLPWQGQVHMSEGNESDVNGAPIWTKTFVAI